MHKTCCTNCQQSRNSITSRSIDVNSNECQMIESEQFIMNDESTQVLIDTDNEEDLTSSGISEDEDDEVEKNCQEGNILQPINHRTNFNTQTVNITFIQAEGFLETTQMNNDHLLAQTMAVLAAKHRHTKPVNSTVIEEDILSFIGPCPLYSLASSFGLDMHHGLSYFPCRDVLANGGGHIPAIPLWQHLTSYSLPSPILFSSTNTQNILRTTPRFSFVRKCPLTNYGVYGIQFEHGARLCSGYTYNTNIYSHLISFHKMTHDGALRLSRAIAFHDKQFQFQFNEIIVNEYIKCPRLKIRPIRKTLRLGYNQCHLSKKMLRIKPVKKISN